jgi:hypothetical protein
MRPLYRNTPSRLCSRLGHKLLAMNANDSNVLFNLGLILIDEGQKAQGQSDIDKAVVLNPELRSRLPAGVSP